MPIDRIPTDESFTLDLNENEESRFGDPAGVNMAPDHMASGSGGAVQSGISSGISSGAQGSGHPVAIPLALLLRLTSAAETTRRGGTALSSRMKAGGPFGGLFWPLLALGLSACAGKSHYKDTGRYGWRNTGRSGWRDTTFEEPGFWAT